MSLSESVPLFSGNDMFERFIHKTLRIPYKLRIVEDTGGSGTPIVFLHGIASSSLTWRNVVPLLDSTVRVITIDLLGFGDSPKPDWSEYQMSDHADAVARTIQSLSLKNVVVVGHSMGSLIAVDLAKRHPKLVARLVLCSMPLYINEDLHGIMGEYTKTDRYINNAYFNVYQAVIDRPDLTLKNAKRVVKLAGNETSFRLDETTWNPFKSSLKNTIENQTTLHDIQQLTIPITIVYGRFDVFVISRYFKQLAKEYSNITVIAVAGRHEISPKYAQVVAPIIMAGPKA